MIFPGNSAEVSQEQHQDRLRRAEKELLVRQMMAEQEQPAIWPKLKGRLSGIIKTGQSTRDKGGDGTYVLNKG